MNTDSVQDQQRESNFSKKKWIIGTALSMAIAGVLAIPFLSAAFFPFSDAARWCIAVTLGGILVGAVQGHVLRGAISSAWAWCFFTAAGWSASAFLMTQVEERYIIMSFGTINIFPVGALTVGLVQWLIFWRHSHYGWTWPLVSVTGAVFGTVFAVIIGGFLSFFAWAGFFTDLLGDVGNVVDIIVIASVIGVILGGMYALMTAFSLSLFITSRSIRQTE